MAAGDDRLLPHLRDHDRQPRLLLGLYLVEDASRGSRYGGLPPGAPGSGHISYNGSGPFVDDIYACGVSTTDRLYCRFAAANPPTTPIAPTRAWLYVNPGGFHTCSLTYAGGAFCWGSNQQGGLGTGGAPAGTDTPTQVAGARTYRGLSASVTGFYTCGVTTGNRAFCWGDNESGQLGDGTSGNDRFTPVEVLDPI